MDITQYHFSFDKSTYTHAAISCPFYVPSSFILISKNFLFEMGDLIHQLMCYIFTILIMCGYFRTLTNAKKNGTRDQEQKIDQSYTLKQRLKQLLENVFSEHFSTISTKLDH